MNQQTRYVMAIYEVGVIIRDTLEYILPPVDDKTGYNIDIYKQRKAMINHLTEENSPFDLFCKNNNATPSKEDESISVGDKIAKQVKEFIDAVYSDDSNIVKIDHDKVVVESSLILQLLDYIVGLHETISDICLGFKNSFEKEGSLEVELNDLLQNDDPFFRSAAFRAVAHTFNVKFAEYNNAVRTYIAQETEKNGVDPSTQPGFNPKDDPSCAFISNEMTRVVEFFRFLRQHNKSTDIIFQDCLSNMTEYFHYFDGSRKLAEGQKMQDVMVQFENIFSPVIAGYRDAWVKVFNKIYAQLVEFEQNMIKAQNTQKAVNNAAEAANSVAKEEKVEEKKE